MIRWYLDVTDVFPENKYTQYVNCGLHVNFWNVLVNNILFYDKKSMIKKHDFKLKVLTLTSDPF